MMYPNLKFPRVKHRPFFYTNFVSTIDGKAQVLKNTKDYWPIGSALDYKTLLELRAYADVLIHGKNTALGHATVMSLSKPEFKKAREKLRKKDILYIVMSNNPNSKLKKHVQHPAVTTEITGSDVLTLASSLHKRGFQHVIIEGGPTIMGSFFKHDLIDEVFVTIAPKIFGNKPNTTLSMVEGYLFPADKIKTCALISVRKVNDEVYLRYRIHR